MEVRPVTTLNWLAQEVLTFALRQYVAVLAEVPLYRVRLGAEARHQKRQIFIISYLFKKEDGPGPLRFFIIDSLFVLSQLSINLNLSSQNN
ncbi:hypothetical protein [Alteribacillus sp. YIM 98480]|uniref:hypothetical protein n=1 Tax=Alteribacillus sp. YIM 98480 TaxID=2606599 RepID=UPI00131CD90A|nr:hypothetical protein [Alteribacillus sp. YIM 98480]